jgi:hypothetical protein
VSTIAHATDDLLADLVHRLDDTVIVGRRRGRDPILDAASERMVGYSREQALGSSLDLIIPREAA